MNIGYIFAVANQHFLILSTMDFIVFSIPKIIVAELFFTKLQSEQHTGLPLCCAITVLILSHNVLLLSSV